MTMFKKQESKSLSQNRQHDDGNIEGNEAKMREAINSLLTLVSGEIDVILFIERL